MDSWLETYLSMTPAERAEMLRKELMAENQAIINGLLDEIDWCDMFIKSTKVNLKELVHAWQREKTDITDEALKTRLKLGAESIELCEKYIMVCRKEISHWTKYPIGSIKRRDYYRTLNKTRGSV